MTLAERIVEKLRVRPLTRPELSILIDEVTSRAILHQLKNLTKHGFVKGGDETSRVYHFITEEGFLEECGCCGSFRPCWTVTSGVCHFCRNSSWLASNKPRTRVNTRTAMYAKDDACAMAYHRLLRSQAIGSRQSNNPV
ncbi:hypothetical protein [Photobacterium sp.]|uniref:hypothetical protein n=1 Tax=Photobacterium sp. TaxID=660 RepID=UPI00299D23BF|nr:hypothetical protein [Photobacterium sp.]MDX1301217.1 hypothetical protein [Photobacterium sp.]